MEKKVGSNIDRVGWDGIGVGLTVIEDPIWYFEACTKLSTPYPSKPSLSPCADPASIAIISSWAAALDRRHPSDVGGGFTNCWRQVRRKD